MGIIEFLLQKSKIVGILIIVIGMLHLLLGKSRWQYYPMYLIGIVYLILALLNHYKMLNLTPGISKWIIGISLLFIVLSIGFVFAFPMEKMPLPSGKFKVATRIYDLEDKSRDENYTDIPGDKRKIKYQVWYPTDNTKGFKKAKWIHDGTIVTRQLAKNMFVPPFMLDHTKGIYSNSFTDAPISNELNKYPVVIISHGWKGFRELHTDYGEELASNGYIAISIDHTYGSQAVVFKDGNIAYINPDALPSFVSSGKYNNTSNLLAKTYGEDVGSVLDDLVNLNNSDDFKDKLDLDKIGVIGHSTGGGGDVYIAQKDIRIKALLGFDAWVVPLEAKLFEKGLSIPTLFISSEQWSQGPNNNALKTIVKHSAYASLIKMKHTKHVDFTMTYMFSPLSKVIGFTGNLPGRQSSQIQREFILNFFNQSLKEEGIGSNDYFDEMARKYDAIEFIDID